MGIHHLWWLIPTAVLAGGIVWSLGAETTANQEPVPVPAGFLEGSLLGVRGGVAEQPIVTVTSTVDVDARFWSGLEVGVAVAGT